MFNFYDQERKLQGLLGRNELGIFARDIIIAKINTSITIIACLPDVMQLYLKAVALDD